jgi:hypothetical protein
MNEYIIIVVFILWYVFSLVVSENIGKQRKIGVEWSFFLSIILSPIIGYIICIFSPKKQIENRVKI